MNMRLHHLLQTGLATAALLIPGGLAAQAPVILQQPQSLTVTVGDTAQFSLTYTGATPVLIEWRKDGPPLADGPGISGTTSNVLTLSNVTLSAAGNYWAVLQNGFGAVTSAVAVLTVNAVATDPAFQPAADGVVNALAAQGDGRWLVGGAFLNLGGLPRTRLARLLPDGTVDPTFSASVDGTVNALAVQPDGRIVVGGSFNWLGSVIRYNLGRLLPDGSLDTAFLPSPNGAVRAIAFEPDGRIWVAGEFSTIGGQNRGRLARLMPDGSYDFTFPLNNISFSPANLFTVVRQPDGKILTAGQPFGLAARIWRLHPDGTVDTNFLAFASNTVHCLALQPDGKILVGGAFTNLSGAPRLRLARLLPNGAVDPTFAPAVSGTVQTLVLQGDGKIILGGAFTNVNGQLRRGLARLLPDGALDSSFVLPLLPVSGAVNGLALTTNGSLLIGGSFTNLGGVARTNFGRALNLAPLTPASFTFDGATATWLIPDAGPELIAPRLQVAMADTWVGNWPLTRMAGGWQATSLPLASNATVRVVDWTVGGLGNGSLGQMVALAGRPFLLNQPMDRGANFGSTAVFGVAVEGQPPFVYQWFKDGTALTNDGRITGATSERLEVSNLNGADAGSYQVILSAGEHWLTSRVATLLVSDPRIIPPNPMHQSVNPGATTSFAVAGAGSPPLTFQWQKNGVPLADGGNVSGATTTNLVLSNVTAADGGSYRLMISNAYGVAFSGAATLTVYRVPQISTQPASRTNLAGTVASFQITVSGNTAFEYQWFRAAEALTNGLKYAGVTGNILYVSNVLGGDVGGYYCVVSNFLGATTSSVATLVVVDPVITNSPANIVTNVGTPVSFGVVAVGTPPLAYQWFKDGLALAEGGPLTGTTSAVLTLHSAQLADAGAYHAVVSNSFGTATSAVATLTVGDPILVSAPVSRTVNLGETATFTTVVRGSPPLAYQWFRDGVPVPGAEQESFSVTNAQAADSGSRWHVVVTNTSGALTTSPVYLVVNTALADPTFNPGAQPSSVRALAMQADGRILVGGEFNTLGGVTRYGLGRLLTGGAVDPDFEATVHSFLGSGSLQFWVPFHRPDCILVQPDGKILVGGFFTNLAGVARQGLARLEADGSADLTFDAGQPWSVSALARQPDGKILVGGNFSTLGFGAATNLGRILPNGSLDPNFYAQVNGLVHTLALRPDGKILAGGAFTEVNGVARTNLALLHSDGTLDETFDPQPGGQVLSLALTPEGKILAGGTFTNVGSLARTNLVRLHPGGTVDESFTSGTDGAVNVILLQSNGRIVLVGSFSTVNGVPRVGLARLEPEGTLDPAFAPQTGNTSVFAAALQPDGHLLVGGNFLTVAGQNRTRIARVLNPDAAPQSLSQTGQTLQWQRGGAAPDFLRAEAEAVTPNGTLSLGEMERLAGGWQISHPAIGSNWTVRLRGVLPGGYRNGSASLAETSWGRPTFLAHPASQTNQYGVPTTFRARTLGTEPMTYRWFKDGQPLTNDARVTGANLAALVVNTTVPTDAGHYWVVASNTFGMATSQVAVLTVAGAGLAAVNGPVRALAVQPDGQLLVGGQFTQVGTLARTNLARLRRDGSVDTTFSAWANSNVQAMAVQPDGRILVGGMFTNLGGQYRLRLGRLWRDGSVDTGFVAHAASMSNPSAAAIHALLIEPMDSIVVGGEFNFLAGQSRVRIGRLTSGGQVFTGLGQYNGPSGNSLSPTGLPVYALALQPGVGVLVGGAFTALASSPSRAYLARYDFSGNVDDSFDAQIGGPVHALLRQPDGKILVGGAFTNIAGQMRQRLARLHANGTLDPGFVAHADGVVSTLALQTDGRIWVGGAFTNIAGRLQRFLARLHPDGSFDDSFAPALNGGLTALALEADGRLIAGGQFSAINGLDRPPLVRLSLPEAAEPAVQFNGPALHWQRAPSAAQFHHATLEGWIGGQWQTLASLTPTTNGWRLDNAPFTAGILLRLRGHTSSGAGNGSGSFEDALAGPPFLLAQPISRTNAPLTDAWFSVTALGGEPLAYQWQKGGDNLPDAGPVSGATSPTLWLAGVLPPDAGAFRVIVSNPWGAVTSAVATLSVPVPPPQLTAWLGTNGLRIEFTGVPQQDYLLQTTTNLAPPVVWENVTLLPADGLGQWSLTLTNLPSEPQRFYRVSAP